MPSEKKSRRWARVFIATGVVGVLAGGVAWMALKQNPTARDVTVDVTAASASDVEHAGERRVLFAHQSVGQNILDALPSVAQNASTTPIPVHTYSSASSIQPGINETLIGENGDPLGKIAAFDQLIRSGAGDVLDVALLKLCYIDFSAEMTNADEIFARYRDTVTALERDYPNVEFLYATTPLVTDRDLVERAKNLLGRGMDRHPDANVMREGFNAQMRKEFGDSGRLFDVALLESAGTDGVASVRLDGDREYLALDEQISSDPGHLNHEGGMVLGAALLKLLAN